MGGAAVAIEAEGVSARVELRFGMIPELRVMREGRTVSMLHRAPWRGEDEGVPPGAAPHLAGLAGDFFCAPFGDASADGAPAHGWPANGTWTHEGTGREGAATVARFRLDRPAMGATLLKELRLVDGHPFLYQRHVFGGGRGMIALANHAMLSLPRGGRVSASPKRWWETPASPLEGAPARGRSALRYPAKADDPTRFPRADGGTADLSRYPFDSGHEDFAIGVEAEGSRLGWTAVARPAEGDLFLSLRDARRLPMTMLWFSNGGRAYAPWNGRHTHVLGIEEGVNRALLGASAREVPHPLDAAGVPTGITLDPDGETEVRHAIGSVSWEGDERIASVAPAEGGLALQDGAGRERMLPCDVGFLGL